MSYKSIIQNEVVNIFDKNLLNLNVSAFLDIDTAILKNTLKEPLN